MSMIASIASFTTILCAALLATCGPAATHARTTTPLLRGGLDASIPPAHTSSSTSISSTSISAVGADDAYTLINGERLLRDPTCFTRPRKGRRRVPCCNIQPCRGRRCRVPGTTTFRRCKRSSAAEVAAQNDVDSSSNGSLNRLVDVMLDEETAYDTATADEEYYYTYEEDDVEDPVHMTAV